VMLDALDALDRTPQAWPWLIYVVVLANGAILAGYFYAAARIAPVMAVRDRTRFAGMWFFVLCGLTHTALNVHALADPLEHLRLHELAHLLPQAVAIWAFVLWWRSDLEALRRERGTVEAPES
jgi:hypothetical protein